jgi:hypothetical protein
MLGASEEKPGGPAAGGLATRTGAARAAELTRLIIDTTVQQKAIAFPATDAQLP